MCSYIVFILYYCVIRFGIFVLILLMSVLIYVFNRESFYAWLLCGFIWRLYGFKSVCCLFDFIWYCLNTRLNCYDFS